MSEFFVAGLKICELNQGQQDQGSLNMLNKPCKRKENEDLGPRKKIPNVELADSSIHKQIHLEEDSVDAELNDMEEGEILSEDEIENDNNSSKILLQESECSERPEGLIQYKSKKVLKNACPKSSLKPLPEGWCEVKHECGLPIYIHATTKVVTWSRPYVFDGQLMKHDVPVTSIPCLNEKKYKEKVQNQTLNNDSENDNAVTSSSASPKAHKIILHTTEESLVELDELNTYLDKRFEFSVIQVPLFEKWSQRRQHNRTLRQKMDVNSKDKTTGTSSLITVTVESMDENNSNPGQKKKVVLTTSGKPMICILHEYAQRVLKAQPKYEFRENGKSLEPFEALITLNGKTYASASAINKKTAKNKAALETLEMLIPGFKEQLEQSKGKSTDSSYFSDVSVTDPRVYELCVHAGQGTPYHLLTEYLKRNQGITDTAISYEIQQVRKKSLSYTIKCGKHEYQGMAKNKKIGKQLGAQQILKMMHPEVTLYKDLIDMYGLSITEERARKKQVEQEIFDLKQKRTLADSVQENNTGFNRNDPANLEPNPELLAKLREMMVQLQQNHENKVKTKMTPMQAALATGNSFGMST